MKGRIASLSSSQVLSETRLRLPDGSVSADRFRLASADAGIGEIGVISTRNEPEFAYGSTGSELYPGLEVRVKDIEILAKERRTVRRFLS